MHTKCINKNTTTKFCLPFGLNVKLKKKKRSEIEINKFIFTTKRFIFINKVSTSEIPDRRPRPRLHLHIVCVIVVCSACNYIQKELIKRIIFPFYNIRKMFFHFPAFIFYFTIYLLHGSHTDYNNTETLERFRYNIKRKKEADKIVKLHKKRVTQIY